MVKRVTAGTAIAMVMCVSPVAASAAVVVGRSIDGIKLGQTQAQVRARLGRPLSSAPGRESRYVEYRVTFDLHHRVLAVFTTSARQKTSKGIHSALQLHSVEQPGSGSTEAEVQQAYPGVTCAPFGQPGKGSPLVRWVIKWDYLGRAVETAFVIFAGPGPNTGEVFYIEVGFSTEPPLRLP